jgi:glycosyltransferase involved in cell wall biosynthesis
MILINAISALQGGGQTYLLNLLEWLPKDLARRVIILCHKKNYQLWEKYRVKEIIISEFASQSILHRAFFEKFLLKKLLCSLGVTVYFAPGGSLPGWRTEKIKMITMFRNMLPFDSFARKRYPFGYLRLKLWILKFVFINSYKKADYIIFISNYGREIIEKFLNQKSTGSEVINHGISDHFRFNKKREHPLPHYPKYVLYVSILDVYKAQLEVILAWKNLLDKRKTSEKLILIGPEFPPYGRKVKKLIKQYKLENEIIILGNVPYQELPAYYQNAKLNLFASSCENCPNILLEALAAGRPILCSEYPPMPEFGKDAVAYFDPYQPDNLSALLLKYLDNKKLRDELGKKALKRSQDFQWMETARRTWEILDSMN